MNTQSFLSFAGVAVVAFAGSFAVIACSSSPNNPAPITTVQSDASAQDSSTTTTPDSSTTTPDSSTTTTDSSTTTTGDAGDAGTNPTDSGCSVNTTITTLTVHFDNTVVPDAARLP